MKIFFLMIAAMALGNSDPALIGTWKYIAYNFDGRTQPRPNPNLDLKFKFFEDGTSELKWFYENEDGFCERRATYETKENNLVYQKVTWVNPDNHMSCGRDADMQLGRETLTPYKIVGDELMFELELNGQPFIYILEFIPKGTK